VWHLERPGFRAEHFTLVTTLLDPVAYPAHEIIAAYARRWRMEMSLNDLKTTLGMEQLRCHKPQMLQKELLVFLTAHNLVRWLMAEAASQEQAPLERISFKGTLDALRQWSQAMAQRRRRPNSGARSSRPLLLMPCLCDQADMSPRSQKTKQISPPQPAPPPIPRTLGSHQTQTHRQCQQTRPP